MRRACGAALGMLLALARAWGAEPEPATPPDFKIEIKTYGIRPEPITSAELVFRKGRAYHFTAEPPLEVIILNPSDERLVLLDLDRLLQSEITMKALDTFRAKLRDAIATAIAKREKEGGRANKVAAAMSRDLIEPRFTATFEPAAHRLRLTNPSVEVDAVGALEPDPARRALIAAALAALIDLDAIRDPKAIPPFPRLDTLKALTADHALRPTEMTVVYRLAGPPRKLRWTYHLVPALTTREVEALSRIETMREKAPFARFEQYERRTTRSSQKGRAVE